MVPAERRAVRRRPGRQRRSGRRRRLWSRRRRHSLARASWGVGKAYSPRPLRARCRPRHGGRVFARRRRRRTGDVDDALRRGRRVCVVRRVPLAAGALLRRRRPFSGRGRGFEFAALRTCRRRLRRVHGRRLGRLFSKAAGISARAPPMHPAIRPLPRPKRNTRPRLDAPRGRLAPELSALGEAARGLRPTRLRRPRPRAPRALRPRARHASICRRRRPRPRRVPLAARRSRAAL
mmetsp:Transcript_21139/g.73131  ORF Transcript_21139/g.73131 Transcript_21139/m.73131 type:complete len:235 (-) Transcript_21139:158-862(-)